MLGHELTFGYTDDGGNKGTEFAGTAPSVCEYSLQSGTNSAVMRDNGNDNNTSTYVQTDIAANSYIGSSTASTAHFQGEMAELIFYNATLNSAQRKIVGTYLAERYGITVTNDLYDNPGFTEDVAGIGRDSAAAFHSAATSAGQLTVKDANSMSTGADDGDFMLFGHNDQTTTDWDPTTNPGIIRLRREWRFDVDGDPGTVTIELDLAALDTTIRTTHPSIALLKSSTGDFDADLDDLYSLNLISGTLYRATGVDISDNDVLTIGGLRNISNVATGDFSNSATWVTGLVPGSGENAIIAASDSVYLTQDVVVGDITIEDGGALNLNGFKLELDQACITINGSGNMYVSSGEVEYSRAGDQCVTDLTYEDITFSSSGRKFLLGDIVVQGDLDIADNVVELDTDGFDISVGGNWTNQGTFTADNGLVIFNGTANQSINATGAGGESFHQVVVNKLSGSVLVESNVTIADSLELTSGIVNLQSNDLTIQNTEADHFNGSASGYLQVNGAGELFFAIAAGEDYDLPIGDDNDYSPSIFSINSLTGTSPSISINLRDSKYPDISTDFVYISRYWTFNDHNVTSIDYTWTFTYTNADVDGGDEGYLEPIKFDGATVNNILDFPTYLVTAAANQCTWSNLTSFSSGTAGVEEGGAPLNSLPVELLYFRVAMQDEQAKVQWATATETNNDHFEIEVSTDGENFDTIAKIAGQGNSNVLTEYSYQHPHPYRGLSYYRLKQVDFDGTVDYSDIVSITNAQKLEQRFEMVVYPNPASADNLHLRITSTSDEEYTVKILGLTGQEYFRQTISKQLFDEKIEAHRQLKSGVYFLIAERPTGQATKRIIIK